MGPTPATKRAALLNACKRNDHDAIQILTRFKQEAQRAEDFDAIAGTAHLYLKQYDDACDHLQRALSKPRQRRIDIYQNLLVALDNLARIDEYKEVTKRLAVEFADSQQFAVARAKVLHSDGCYREALAHINSALALDSRCILAEAAATAIHACTTKDHAQQPSVVDRQLLELAFLCLHDAGESDEALALVNRLIHLFPSATGLLANKAIVQLKQRQFEEGFKNYQTRETRPFGLTKDKEDRAWTLMNEKRALQVVAEQGLGDTLQFARYLYRLPSSVAVHFCPQEPLYDLYKSCATPFSVARPAELSQSTPTVSLMSLPHLTGEKGFSLSDHCNYLRGTASDGRSIGVVWKGNQKYKNDFNRSIRLQEVVHLIKRDNATIVQQGLTDEEAQLLGANNLKPIHLGSFQDTRKLLNTLAGVVTVDTSVAHLAGAMGIRTVVVLPHNSDWRWHDDQYLSSWYNTIYLVRRAQTDRTGALAFERALMLLQELVQSKQA